MPENARPTCRAVVRKLPSSDNFESLDRFHWQNPRLARRRQMQRRKRQRWLGNLARWVTALWLMLGAFLPAIFYGYTNTQAAALLPVSHLRTSSIKSSSLAISAFKISATPIAETQVPTATPSPTPAATATPTPLPPRLVQATSWQATLEQAAVFSYATQTQAAGQYRSTQTALPPILTANALDRDATATASAR